MRMLPAPDATPSRPAWPKWAAVAALSLGFHALLLCALWLLPPAQRHEQLQTRPVALRTLRADEWMRNRGDLSIRPFQGSDVPEEVKRPEEKPPPDGQVVAVAPGNGQEDPDAKFLAERANRVDQQTVARDRTRFYKNAMPQRTSPTPSAGPGMADATQRAGNLGRGEDEKPAGGGRAPGEAELPQIARRDQVKLKPDETDGPGPGAQVENRQQSAALDGNSSRLRLPGGLPGESATSQGRSGQPGHLSLLPSESVMDEIAGAAANDRIDGVGEGEGTFLNTREWRYAGFFNRVKQSVGEHWDPASKLQVRDPTGEIYGGRDRYTLVGVTLYADGRLKDVTVEKSSGLDFLDVEAVQSFQRAQPFPNPPPGLLMTDSTVRFQFGFFVELGSGPKLRVYRSQN